MDEKEIVLFQIDRQIKSLFKDCLILIEERDAYIKRLEKTLSDMGITVYENSPVDYQKDRKIVLSRGNDKIRELTELIEAFNITFKK